MKIEKVTYQHPFIIGPFLQRKVGFEAALDEGEDPKEALNQLKAIAEEWDKESNPGQTITVDQDVLQKAMGPNMPPKVINREVERLMILLENAATVEELEGYEKDVERLAFEDAGIYPAYCVYYKNLKQKELINP